MSVDHSHINVGSVIPSPYVMWQVVAMTSATD
jgi:hypothetical protein